MRFIRDPRDLPFVWVVAGTSAILLPTAAILIADPTFSWWLADGYLIVMTASLSCVLVIYHEITHRPLFRPRYRFLMQYINWVFGPLFGLFPNAFYAHHVIMHHAENNQIGDLSSTMRYQRDRLLDLIRYSANFQITVLCTLAMYLWRRKRYRLLRAVLVGEVAYVAAAGVVAFFNWKAALVVFAIPLMTSLVGLSFTNWTEHVFIDHASPQSIYRSAIICVNTIYNWVAFNDGYHLSHHLKPNMHWTDKPEELRKQWATYLHEDAIIFEQLSYYPICFLLLTKQYRALARRCVDVSEGRRSEREMMEILQRRVAKFTI